MSQLKSLRLSRLAWQTCAIVLGGWLTHSVQAQTCQVTSGAKAPAVVELYTSEGCSSCPPADRWLSAMKNTDDVVALSFHVNYWNHLGWTDRFATPETTGRQRLIRAATGGQYMYTPQVVLNGQDHRHWHGDTAKTLRSLKPEQAPSLRLQRDGQRVTAQIGPTGAHSNLAGYWAVLQDGLASKVTRGENAGETLTHDHVVSRYLPVAPWSGVQGQTLQLDVPNAPQLRVVFVVTDPGLTRPVQGLSLSCS